MVAAANSACGSICDIRLFQLLFHPPLGETRAGCFRSLQQINDPFAGPTLPRCDHLVNLSQLLGDLPLLDGKEDLRKSRL